MVNSPTLKNSLFIQNILRLPCAGGGRVLAAERAMLRIACFIFAEVELCEVFPQTDVKRYNSARRPNSTLTARSNFLTTPIAQTLI